MNSVHSFIEPIYLVIVQQFTAGAHLYQTQDSETIHQFVSKSLANLSSSNHNWFLHSAVAPRAPASASRRVHKGHGNSPSTRTALSGRTSTTVRGGDMGPPRRPRTPTAARNPFVGENISIMYHFSSSTRCRTKRESVFARFHPRIVC